MSETKSVSIYWLIPLFTFSNLFQHLFKFLAKKILLSRARLFDFCLLLHRCFIFRCVCEWICVFVMVSVFFWEVKLLFHISSCCFWLYFCVKATCFCCSFSGLTHIYFTCVHISIHVHMFSPWIQLCVVNCLLSILSVPRTILANHKTVVDSSCTSVRCLLLVGKSKAKLGQNRCCDCAACAAMLSRSRRGCLFPLMSQSKQEMKMSDNFLQIVIEESSCF